MKSFGSIFSRHIVTLRPAPFLSEEQKVPPAADKLPSSTCSNIPNVFKNKFGVTKVLVVEARLARTLERRSRLTPKEVERISPHIIFHQKKINCRIIASPTKAFVVVISIRFLTEQPLNKETEGNKPGSTRISCRI